MLMRIAAAILMLGVVTQAHALTIGGWEVPSQPDKDGDCVIHYTYKDANDGNKSNTIVMVFSKNSAGTPITSIVFGYDGWSHEKNDTAEADFLIGDTVEQRKVTWKATRPNVYAALLEKPDALLDELSYAKTMSLRFGPDSTAEFKTPNIGMAVGGALVCRSLIK